MMDEREEFYNRCSAILNIEHEYHVPFKRRNRWNARRKGNGRFPGFGLVQCYGPGGIRVVSAEHGTHWFKEYNQVYDFLTSLGL